MPTTELTNDDFTDGKIGVIDMLLKAELAPSRGEAKRLIQQGGVLCADEKVADFAQTVEKEAFVNGLIIKKGKKTFHKFVLK